MMPPTSAPRDSIFPCPYVWSSSGGFNDRLVATRRINVDTASNAAWPASLRSDRLFVVRPAIPSSMITDVIARSESWRALVLLILGICQDASTQLEVCTYGLIDAIASGTQRATRLLVLSI